MSGYRLLIDFAIVDFILAQKPSLRAKLRDCCLEIGNDPIAVADYVEKDSTGRPIHVRLAHDFAFDYWIDHADKHVKILRIASADRR